jgi:hypothetical protein
MSWYKVAFDEDANQQEIDGLFSKTTEKHIRSGGDKGFAVFSEVMPTDKGLLTVFYYSPVAAQHCQQLLADYSAVPCDKPAPASALSLKIGGRSSFKLLE